MGWNNRTTFPLLIVPGSIPPNSGLYVYSGPAAAGDLIASIAAANGFDAHTNAVLAGISSYDPVLIAAVNLANGAVSFYAAGTEHGPWSLLGQISDGIWQEPAASGLLLKVGAVPAQVQVSTALVEVTVPALFDDRATFIPISGPPAPASGVVLYTDSTFDQLRYRNGAGTALALVGANPANTALATVTQAAFATLGSTTILAGDAANAGQVYRWTAYGYGTWGSTQQQLGLGARLGTTTASIAGNTAAIAATALPAGAAFQWKATVTATLVTTGVAATWRVSLEGTIQPTGGLVTLNGSNTIQFATGTGPTDYTQDSTVQFSIGLSADWQATTGAPTITKAVHYFEKVA